MPDDRIILHHYDISPFSEKVRIAFGIKGLVWHAVDQPTIMPKPELVPLTGGYRRIPVMQIGADIYCDSQLILRELERRHPNPSLHVGGDAGLSYGLGFWSDRPFFMAAVGVIFGAIQIDEAFLEDRSKLMGRPFDPDALRAAAPGAAEQLRAHTAFLAEQLADGRAFLLGDDPGLTDVHAYYNLWFVRSFHPAAAVVFDRAKAVSAWEARVRGIGHGERHEMTRERALTIAAEAKPATAIREDPEEPNGLRPGDRVAVVPDDYGPEVIEGELVASSAYAVALARTEPELGELVVHFPRAGFVVSRC